MDSGKGIKFLGLRYIPSPYVNGIDFMVKLPRILKSADYYKEFIS